MKLLTAALAALLLAAPRLSLADAGEAELFRAANAAREQAEAAEAALLAPSDYGAGVAALDRAHRDYGGGAEAGAVERLLEQARGSLEGARRIADQARLTLATPLAEREAARKVEAYRLAGSAWVQAEEELRAAAQRLEKGDASGAQKRGDEAARLFDAAELQAIKAALLADARKLVAALGPAGTARMAPKTTASAQSLLRQAEAELDADRTRTDPAARLAAGAAGEARHAVALAQYLQAMRERDATSEDLVLEWESGLGSTAVAAGTVADFSGGPRRASDEVGTAVGELRNRSEQQARELEQRDRQISALEEQVRDLDGRLAGASNEAQSLNERLEIREQASARYGKLERVFQTDEAVVLRQGDDIIVRIQGLAFPAGSAKLAVTANPMLAKLSDVIAVYPRALYAVEGHTDSTGDSAANQRLSQARADAVRKYMVEHLELPPGRITAIGYGDSRPIAKNESEEGRRQNRRIDLVITTREEVTP